jgi:hypothetical protein
VLAFSSWVLCRVVLFAYALIYSTWVSVFNVLIPKMNEKLDQEYKNIMFVPILFMAGMLVVLQGLQLFWTYYILKSYISVNVSSKLAKHTYD